MSDFWGWLRGSFRSLLHTGTPPSEYSPSADGFPRVDRRRRGRHSVPQRSLFGEILDWMFAPIMLVWPVSIAITFVVARSIADRPYDAALMARAQVVVERLRIVDNQVILPTLPAASNESAESRMYVQVVGGADELLAGQPDIPRPGLYDFPEPGRLKLRNDVYLGDEVRIAYAYLDNESENYAPLLLVQVMESQTARTQLANDIIKSVILPQFLILPLAGGLVWFGLARGLRPLEALRKKVRDRDPADPSPIDPAEVPQEITPLVDSFNDLLHRLTESVDAQKRFVADAAHQIRTPLAGLRTQAELAMRQDDMAEIKADLERLVQSTDRATRLVNQLLSLARTDAQRDPLPLTPLNLTHVARATTSDWVERAMARQIDLGVETSDEKILVRGHDMLLRELLSNLIENALRYSPPGSMVTVRAGQDSTVVFLEVEDNGPGIPAAERGRVFDRFYRVLGTNIEGSGLGLAIVKEIAGIHGTHAELHETHPGTEPRGLRVRLTFPKPPL